MGRIFDAHPSEEKLLINAPIPDEDEEEDDAMLVEVGGW